MKMDIKNEEPKWKSKTILRMLMFTQFTGVMNVTIISNTAIMHGVTGYVILLIFFYAFLGTPLTYMESIVGQFTERDCIEVWKIRPCLAHIGYIVIIWQFFMLIFNHAITSLLLHYFLISFENPLPFFTCGSWSDKDCNIMLNNYTINQECTEGNTYPYCDSLYLTYPEYQYWRFHLLHNNTDEKFYVTWRVCLASALICLAMHFICFKREVSLGYSEPFICATPIVGLLIIFLGSMRQVGVVANFEDAIDMDFTLFLKKFRLSHLVELVVQNLGIGTGLTFNLASTSSFRTTCFSNCVVCVSICAMFTTTAIFTVAMMTCPYSLQYDESIEFIFKAPLYLAYERFPRFLNIYDYTKFYLIVLYGILSILGLGTNVLVYFNILEVIMKRSAKLRYYPSLTCFGGCVIIFLITIPLLSNFGLNMLAFVFRRHMILVSTFIALLECLVFVLWYGIHRFSEDVHFMLGIQPTRWMKFAWFSSNICLCYVFFAEMMYQLQNWYLRKGFSPYVNIIFVLIICIGILIQIIVASFRKEFRAAFALDPQWGPKSEVLQRSRGMFSAQAMTKEYLYRQYHLQAGILARQKRSNIRV